MVEVQDRTRESFQRLASAELPALYWLARRLVRDGAEDLVQETLLRAYRSYGTLELDAAAGPWLKSILVNVHRDQLRRQPARRRSCPLTRSRTSRCTRPSSNTTRCPTPTPSTTTTCAPSQGGRPRGAAATA